jgi:hypothetical protein
MAGNHTCSAGTKVLVLLCQAVLLLTAVLLFIIPFENPFKPFSKFSLIKHLLFVA